MAKLRGNLYKKNNDKIVDFSDLDIITPLSIINRPGVAGAVL